jgi:hypothetical protein
MQTHLGQGATEYLVLLAVVLIIALVSVALLGFFPGMASDAQLAQSKAYWQSASPIAITEVASRYYSADGSNYPYLRMKNNGGYPITITGIVGGDGSKATTYASDPDPDCGITGGAYSISSYFTLSPGEEKYFVFDNLWGNALCDREISFSTSGSAGSVVGGAKTVCLNSTASPGVVVFNSIGFEYTATIDGQSITKRQIGSKPLIVKCIAPA